MNLYQIDISGGFGDGGYSGTVEVSEGTINVEFPTANMSNGLRRDHLHLLAPDRKNIEFGLLRFPDGECCEQINLQFDIPPINPELRDAVKKEIDKMKI